MNDGRGKINNLFIAPGWRVYVVRNIFDCKHGSSMHAYGSAVYERKNTISKNRHSRTCQKLLDSLRTIYKGQLCSHQGLFREVTSDIEDCFNFANLS